MGAETNETTHDQPGAKMMTTQIKRVEAPELRGYPRNGNADSQAMAYRWLVVVGGKVMATESTLRAAKDAASYYTAEKVQIQR
jgi:hypothetical protein